MTGKDIYRNMSGIHPQFIMEAAPKEETVKSNTKAWAKWGAMAACLCLMAAGIIAALGLHGKSGRANPQPSGTPAVENTGSTAQLVVNPVDSVMASDMDVDVQTYSLGKLPSDVWEAIAEAFHSFVGVTYEEFTGKIPDEFELFEFYSLSTRGYKDGRLSDEYLMHDYVFGYQTENGGRAIIALCSYEEPLRDCLIECDHVEKSVVNGNDVRIYGYQGIFIVQFSYENVNYEIETSKITLEELEDLLMGIIVDTAK